MPKTESSTDGRRTYAGCESLEDDMVMDESCATRDVA